MEITEDNFLPSIDIVSRAIDECDFLAVDAELTGLYSSLQERRPSVLDSHQERYDRLRVSVAGITPIQFGICTFKLVQNESNGAIQSIEAKPFNFCLFPRSLPFWASADGKNEKFFSCQASSLRFLQTCGFDFNKCFGKGINFVSESKANYIKEKLVERKEEVVVIPSDPIDVETLGAAEKSHVRKAVAQIEDFIKNKQSEAKEIVVNENELNETNFGEQFDSLLLPTPLNPFLRKVIHQEVKHRTDIFLVSEADASESSKSEKKMRAYFTGTENNRKILENLKLKKEIEKLEKDAKLLIGFTEISNQMMKSKKPVLTHNSYLDWIHILKSFHLDDLPELVDDFCKELHSRYPIVLDTKHLLSSGSYRYELRDLGVALGTTSVTPAWEALKNMEECKLPVEIVFPDGYNTYTIDENNDRSHEAGFDAYMTGEIFLRSLAYLKFSFRDSASLRKLFAEDGTLFESVNKIHYMNAGDGELGYLKLDGNNEEPRRDTVLTLSNLSKGIRNQNIFMLAQQSIQYSNKNPNINVRGTRPPKIRVNVVWVDDKNCHVCFSSLQEKLGFLEYFLSYAKPNLHEWREAIINEYTNDVSKIKLPESSLTLSESGLASEANNNKNESSIETTRTKRSREEFEEDSNSSASATEGPIRKSEGCFIQ